MAKKKAARKKTAGAAARTASSRKGAAKKAGAKKTGRAATARARSTRKTTRAARSPKRSPSAARSSAMLDVRNAEIRKDIGGVRLEAGRAGDGRVKRMIYPPGYKWSVDTKPYVEHAGRPQPAGRGHDLAPLDLVGGDAGQVDRNTRPGRRHLEVPLV